MNSLLRGLYAISDGSHGQALIERVSAALKGGARIVQYRDKGDDQYRRRRDAAALTRLCRQHGVPLIVNDDLELALAADADGVHLGRADTGIAAARAKLGQDKLIGASCYDSLELARQAVAAGADYIAFGSFFASPTKPQAVHADLGLLREARRLGLPVVAIGGITPENGPALIDAGADMLAVISSVFAQTDVAAAARCYSHLFDPQETAP